jgi:hypothetical protein
MKLITRIAAAALSASLMSEPVLGGIRLANVSVAGTLTCTTDPATSGRADAKLSCHLKASSGRDGNYTGYIARIGPADVPEGRRVLIWTVLTQNASDIPDMAGLYKGETGGVPSGVLVGGRSGTVRLEPVTTASQVGKRSVPTILELRLEAIKA